MPTPEDFSQLVADRVMGVIASRGLSVRQVAAMTGINHTTLHGRIHNVRPFTTAELALVADALGVDPASFVTPSP